MPQSLSKVLIHVTFSTKDRHPFLDAHHKKETFQDEFRRFLRQYGIEHDEQYVWD